MLAACFVLGLLRQRLLLEPAAHNELRDVVARVLLQRVQAVPGMGVLTYKSKAMLVSICCKRVLMRVPSAHIQVRQGAREADGPVAVGAGRMQRVRVAVLGRLRRTNSKREKIHTHTYSHSRTAKDT